MRRGLVLLLGVATIAAGIWVIATEHTRDAACKGTHGQFSGWSSACTQIGWMYLAGFALVGIGVIVLLSTMVMRRREGRMRRRGDDTSEMSLRLEATGGTVDDAMDTTSP